MAALILSLGTLTLHGAPVGGLDDYVYTPVACVLDNKTLTFTQGITRTVQTSLGIYKCLQPTRYQFQGKVRFGHAFSIRAQCSTYAGDPADQQATHTESYGIYFELCPLGGRAVKSCVGRTIRHPWPAQSSL